MVHLLPGEMNGLSLQASFEAPTQMQTLCRCKYRRSYLEKLQKKSQVHTNGDTLFNDGS